MILTVCCNPCIDKYVYVSDFKKSALNRVKGTLSCVGGKGINVAKAVAVLGEKVCTTGFMSNTHENLFTEELNKLGIATSFTLFLGDTRTNYKINDTDGSITEMNEEGPNISEDLQLEFLSRVSTIDCDFVVLSGSLPKGVPNTFYKEVARRLKVPFAVDAEKSKLLPTLSYQPEIIKPNIHELEEIAGTKLISTQEVVKECCKLVTLGAKRVLVSLGDKGAIYVDEDCCYMARAPKVTVKSTVGAGDSMLASSCISILKCDTGVDILRKAVASGTAGVMSDGTNPLLLSDYEDLLKKVEVTKI